MNDAIQFIEAVMLYGVSNEKKYIKKLDYCIELFQGTKLGSLLVKFKEDTDKEYLFLLITKFVVLYSRSI